MTWWATDTMVLNDKEYSIVKPMELVNFRDDYNLDWEVYTTAGNGCDATFVVKDNLLILDKLSVNLKKNSDYPKISGVMPKLDKYGIATYCDIGLRINYTGMCLIGQNRIDFSKWKQNIVLEFKEGLLLKTKKSKKSTEKTLEWIYESKPPKPPLTVGDILDMYNRKRND